MKEIGFIGRDYELKQLNNLTQKRAASLVVIQGRRRIGKSRLVEEFSKKYKFYRFSGLPPTSSTSIDSERDEFSKQLANNFKISNFKTTDWSDLFSFLARETQQGRVIILLDEITWMGSKDPDFLGKLKNAWDIELKKNPELILILCGSVSAWIDENILKSTGFVGRISLVLNLKELSLKESNQMLNAIGFRGSIWEKFKLLSITGGIPRYLEEIRKDCLADENIKDLCFTPGGILFREFKEIFVDIFSRRSDSYREIVQSLVEGEKDLSEIVLELNTVKNGHLSAYLEDLIKSGFVRKSPTWNLRNGKISSLLKFRVIDNYLRFYLKYIEKNQQKIENSHFNFHGLESFPGFASILGLQFENIVLNNREPVWNALRLFPETIVMEGPYFQRPTARQRGSQIDYLIQTRTDVLYACEIKFSMSSIGLSVIDEMKEKLSRLAIPKGFSLMPVLIHINGVTESVEESEYFSHIMNFGDLLKS